MLSFTAPWIAYSLALPALAASFPPTPEGVTTLQSSKFPGVSISFKETSICETTKGVKGYSGYVNLPPGHAADRPPIQCSTLEERILSTSPIGSKAASVGHTQAMQKNM